MTGKGTKGYCSELEALGTVGQRAPVALPTRLFAAGVVVVDLDDTVLDAHGVVGAALVESGEEAIAAADDGAGMGLPS